RRVSSALPPCWPCGMPLGSFTPISGGRGMRERQPKRSTWLWKSPAATSSLNALPKCAGWLHGCSPTTLSGRERRERGVSGVKGVKDVTAVSGGNREPGGREFVFPGYAPVAWGDAAGCHVHPRDGRPALA